MKATSAEALTCGDALIGCESEEHVAIRPLIDDVFACGQADAIFGPEEELAHVIEVLAMLRMSEAVDRGGAAASDVSRSLAALCLCQCRDTSCIAGGSEV